MHKLCIGIDLGTTYSAIAWLNEHGQPEVLENEEGERTTPSVVLFDGDDIVVGRDAKDNLVAYPGQTAEFVKRFMGDDPGFAVPRPEVQSARNFFSHFAEAEAGRGGKAGPGGHRGGDHGARLFWGSPAAAHDSSGGGGGPEGEPTAQRAHRGGLCLWSAPHGAGTSGCWSLTWGAGLSTSR